MRLSQYITTYGPGSIIETRGGPYVLCSTEYVLERMHNSGLNIENYAINDYRLQHGLLDGARIFKIPDENTTNFIYPTKKFPTWNLCLNHNDHNIIHRAVDGCPECRSVEEKNQSRQNIHAVRFLVACPNGHLDDVNWKHVVHLGRNNNGVNCRNSHFHWIGSGSSLESVRIRCPSCKTEKKLYELYSSSTNCKGRRVENYKDEIEKCDSKDAIIVSRGSFQLRLPEVITSLKIPPFVNSICNTLERDEVHTIIKDLKDTDNFNKDSFFKLLQRRVNEKKTPQQILVELQSVSWDEITQNTEEMEQVSTKKTLMQYLEQEHKKLLSIIDSGYPPRIDAESKQQKISFEVDVNSIDKEISSPSGKFKFRIMPINRLSVVLVQKAYRRVDYVSSKSVPSPISGTQPGQIQKWFPGVEQYGEGIYIDLNPEVSGQINWYPNGESANNWDQTVPANTEITALIHWNALSVWWHTLSHRLITAMSLHSGYSSTAIRERVYLSKSEDGSYKGGLLLYTTQPGGDGTMGGLTSLATDFQDILQLAVRGVDRCSNDPLCESVEIDEVSKLGAACYSCQIISETSCEHYNGYLDRRLLLDEESRL